MKKTLILSLLLAAGIAHSQTIEDCEMNEFSTINISQHLETILCSNAKDCQYEIDSIKKHCTSDMIIKYDLSVAKALANLSKKHATYVAAAKESKRKAALPGVRIGMTKEQVLKETNWGRPQSINRTTTASGTREQWVYGYPNYLYFHNNVLVSIQN